MTVYNGEKYLPESIDSILKQTYTDFEFMIIDDASTDLSRDIIHSHDDTRIKLIENAKNIGQVESLNRGLEKAKGEYIARMDQDDISLPKRLECQLTVMEKNKNVGVCGTFAQFIDKNGRDIHINSNEEMMTENEDLKTELLFRSCFLHPTVIIRSSLIKDNLLYYEKDSGYGQDYRLWYRMTPLCDFMNLEEKLLKYRIHSNQMSNKKRNDQFISSNVTRKIVLENFLSRKINQREEIKHAKISISQHGSTLIEVKHAESWLLFLRDQNEISKKYCKKSLSKVLNNIWTLICMNSSHLGVRLLLRYFNSIFWKWKNENILREIKMIIKCLIKHKVKFIEYDYKHVFQEIGFKK
tara:strand:- start:350 stop:1411 length:1062 start_codon:yes stop_codon:yes gene_type:complete